jgi:hypothetical protein
MSLISYKIALLAEKVGCINPLHQELLYYDKRSKTIHNSSWFYREEYPHMLLCFYKSTLLEWVKNNNTTQLTNKLYKLLNQ